MPDVLVRNVDPKVLLRLKARARKNKRSLQAEINEILEQAAGASLEDFRALAKRTREMFKGRTFSDSAELIREDRDSR